MNDADVMLHVACMHRLAAEACERTDRAHNLINVSRELVRSSRNSVAASRVLLAVVPRGYMIGKH